MKKLFFLFFSAIFFFSAQAQLTKGNWLAGGSASFYSSKSTFTSTTYNTKSEEFNLSIAPNIGYFPVDKFAVGLSPSFSWGRGEVTTPAGATTNIKRFLIGPFARYYLLNAEKPFNILVGAAYQYGIYSFKPTTGNIRNFSVGIGPVVYFNSAVGLEFTFGYASRVEDIKDTYKTTQKGLQIGIGFQIHLENE